MLLRYVAYDILTDLNETFDDRKVELPQVVYWILIIGNRLKAQQLGSQKYDSGAFLATYTDIPIVTQTTNTNPDVVKERKHFILPASIYDFREDRGINYIAYTSNGNDPKCPPRFTKVTFARTTPKASQLLYFNPHEKPSPINPYFYRTGNYIYLLGLEEIPTDYVEVGLYTTLDPIQTIDIDQNFDFPEELLETLKKEVLSLGSFVFAMPQDRQNTGSQEVDGQIPSKKLVSVNQQLPTNEQPQQ